MTRRWRACHGGSWPGTVGLGVFIVLTVLASLPRSPWAQTSESLESFLTEYVYESPGFRIRIVDKETGQPLEGIHALAEWYQYADRGTGVFMAQDAVSGPDGVLVFPPWGPFRGYHSGLILQYDPVITLFKPGYVLPPTQPGDTRRAIRNVGQEDTSTTKRVRRFGRDGATYAMERFEGTLEEWVRLLKFAAHPDIRGGLSDEELRRARGPFLSRLRLVKIELDRLPQDRADVKQLRVFLDILFKSFGGS